MLTTCIQTGWVIFHKRQALAINAMLRQEKKTTDCSLCISYAYHFLNIFHSCTDRRVIALKNPNDSFKIL